jgi:pimeloyl-ACP methyl ester carboxylesterase
MSPAMDERAATGRTLPPPDRVLRVRSSGGGEINTEIHGPDGATTVVLIHGWTCSIPFWAPVIEQVRGELRIVAYDQRGHGRSDPNPPGEPYSTRILVEDLTAVLDATVPDGGRVILAGHSMGGMTIMAAAESASVLERTGAALLASTGFEHLAARSRVAPFADRWPKVGAAVNRRMLLSSAPMGSVTAVSRALLKYGTLGPQASKELAARNAGIVQACPRTVRYRWGRVLDALDLSASVGRLDVPTAVLVGTADRLTPPVHARQIAERLPQCTGLTELPGIGHMTPLEAPDRVAGQIRVLATTLKAA